MERNPRQEIRVGLFVVAFIALIAGVTFVLGGSGEMFARRYQLVAFFQDVKGLKAGAVVRLAGIDVGEVSLVEFSPAPGDKNIKVQMTILRTYEEHVRADSVASISTVGVLGDMFISLSVGSPDQPAVAAGAVIKSAEPLDFVSYAGRATEIVENAARISHKVDLLLGTEDAASQAAVGESLTHLEAMLAQARDGKGVLNTLLYDEQAGRKLDRILSNVEVITADVASVTTQIREGDGIAHALVYGEGGDALAVQLAGLAQDLDGLVRDIKEKDSVLHTLLYDEEKARMVEDLAATASNLRSITASVNDGEGTAGLFVRDPQLYEDLRLLFGGAQRNALLRAYVRSTVARAKDEEGDWRAPSDDPDMGGR